MRDLTELDKLESYLKKEGADYSRNDVNDEKFDWHQIRVYEGGYEVWDAICHLGSYGSDRGLLEIAGVIVNGTDVEGYLTADDVISRIEARG